MSEMPKRENRRGGTSLKESVPFTFKHKCMEHIEAVRGNDVAKESIKEKGHRKGEPKLFGIQNNLF